MDNFHATREPVGIAILEKLIATFNAFGDFFLNHACTLYFYDIQSLAHFLALQATPAIIGAPIVETLVVTIPFACALFYIRKQDIV